MPDDILLYMLAHGELMPSVTLLDSVKSTPKGKWLPPWRKGGTTCLWIKSIFDCLTIGFIHETMVVHMIWVWTFFNNHRCIYIHIHIYIYYMHIYIYTSFWLHATSQHRDALLRIQNDHIHAVDNDPEGPFSPALSEYSIWHYGPPEVVY